VLTVSSKAASATDLSSKTQSGPTTEIKAQAAHSSIKALRLQIKQDGDRLASERRTALARGGRNMPPD